MGLIKRLKKIKLKKLQPGRLVQRGLKAAAAVGVPGAGTLSNVADRIGKRVEDAKKVAQKVTDTVKREAKEAGITQWEAADNVAQRGLAAANAALDAGTPEGKGRLLLAGGAVLLLFLLLRRK